MTQAIRALQGQYHHQQLRKTERSTAGQFSPMKCFVVSQISGKKGTAAILSLGAVPCMMSGHARKELAHFNKLP